MPALDTNAIILSSSAINVCVGLILMAFIRRSDVVQLHWCAVAISYGVAGLLIGFREFLPPWLAIICANVLVGLSVALIHRGTWLMVGRRPPDRIYAVSLVALAAIYYQFTYPTPDIGIRLFAVSLFRVPYFIGAAIALRGTPQLRGLGGTNALIGLLLVGACWYLLRGGLALSSDAWAVQLRTGSMQSINFLIAAVVNVMMTVSLFRVDAEQAIQRNSDLALQLKEQLDRLQQVTVSRDLLEAETAERRTSEAKYRRLYESLRDAAVTSDVAGRLVEWNGMFRDLLGYRDDELSRMTLEQLIPAQERGVEERIVANQVLPRGYSDVYELELLRKDGMIFTAELRTFLLQDDASRPIGMWSLVRDITERKRTDALVWALKEEAERANKAKSVFLANMSHEIRTPMNAVLGFAQILQRSSALTSTDRENLEVIHRSGRNLLALINDVLEMSKIEAGRIELTPKSFDLRELLGDIESMFRLPAIAKGLQWEVITEPRLPRYIAADEGKLRQILINLIGNAVKFTENGGVVLRAGTTSPIDSRPHLVIEVEDSGVGISSEELGWLFDPFRQTASGAKVGGTGLGLAISRRHARLMSGDITVTSVPGRGSIFRLELPVQEVSMADVETPKPRHRILGVRRNQGEIRILAVDDKPDNRLYLTRLLEPLGFTLRQACNGDEAIAVCREWKPRLILMDIVMPVMDGREATRRIKAMGEGKDIVIVALSASAFEEDREAVMATGANDFLRKPVSAEELLVVIGKHLDLAYDYAEDTAGPSTTAVAARLHPEMRLRLPTEILDAMRLAIYRSDDHRLAQLINGLPPDLDDIAAAIRQAAAKFDWDILEDFVGPPSP